MRFTDLIVKRVKIGGDNTLRALKARLPTRQETILLLIVCVFPIHVWSIFIFLHKVPGYLQRLNIRGIMGIFAYTQVFSLLESIMVMVILILLSMILPKRFFRDKIVVQSAIFVSLTSVWVLPVHYQALILQGLSLSLRAYLFLIWFWIISLIAAGGGLSLLIRRNKRFENVIMAFVERLAVLSIVYILIDVLSFFVILSRNLI